MKTLIKLEKELENKKLVLENRLLRSKLAEAEETLNAIRNGEVDALVVKGKDGDSIYTLEGTDHLYRILVETMNEGAVTATFDRNITYCNQQFANIIKTPIEKITGVSLDHFVLPDDLSALNEIIEQGLQKTSRGEIRLITGNNRIVYVLISCNPFKMEIPGVSIVITELTEIKRIQEELENTNDKLEELVIQRTRKLTETNEKLRASEENLQNIIKFAPTGIYEIDYLTPKFRTVNEAMCNISGFSKEELLQINPFDLLDDEGKERFRERIHKIHRGENIDEIVEYRIKRKDESYIWVILNIKLLYRNDHIDGALVVAYDITERKKMEEQLRKKNEKLVKINEVLEDFVYITAHDLRAPISNMKMLIEYMRVTDEPDKKITLLNHLAPFIKSLERTIDGMVETIHVQKTDTTLCKNVCMRQLFDLVKEELKEEIQKSEALIITNFLAKEIIYVDTYLISIMINFISNSIKYASPGKKPEIEIETEKDGEYVLLRIKDNGIGIDLEREGKDLFKPFKRFTAQAEGTGMGLYIVKNIVEKNGGYIDIESKPGDGTIFYCYLKEYEM